MTNPPDDVALAVQALKLEIDRLVAGEWDRAGNAASARILRSLAEDVVLSAKKVKEAVVRITHPNA